MVLFHFCWFHLFSIQLSSGDVGQSWLPFSMYVIFSGLFVVVLFHFCWFYDGTSLCLAFNSDLVMLVERGRGGLLLLVALSSPYLYIFGQRYYITMCVQSTCVHRIVYTHILLLRALVALSLPYLYLWPKMIRNNVRTLYLCTMYSVHQAYSILESTSCTFIAPLICVAKSDTH